MPDNLKGGEEEMETAEEVYGLSRNQNGQTPRLILKLGEKGLNEKKREERKN